MGGLAGDAPPLWPPRHVVNKAGASPGFTLFTAGSSGTHLIDNAGRVVHHWEHALANARMLPNGNLIGKQDNFLFEMDPQGRLA